MKRTDATPSSSTVVKKLESHGHCVLYVWYCGIGIKERALELGGAAKSGGRNLHLPRGRAELQYTVSGRARGRGGGRGVGAYVGPILLSVS